MCVHGRSPVFMFCLTFFSPIHPFIEINIGFKRRSLSDCSTLGWIVFDFFAIHLYKGWRTPSAWWRLDVFKVSFVCKIGYIMQDTKLLFLLHAPPLECNSCALANLTHHWGESPALTFTVYSWQFVTKHQNPKICQWLGMISLSISEGN